VLTLEAYARVLHTTPVGRVRTAFAAGIVALVLACGAPAGARDASTKCGLGRVSGAYAASVRHALRAGRDVWGEALLRSREGPTYNNVARRLTPLFYAVGPQGDRIGDSGVYYLPFAWPTAFGAQAIALHVADGGTIYASRTSGPKLTISVGSRGQERYGSCLARLSTPQLLAGYLPALETRYADAGGVHYAQESFAARIGVSRSLVSFVRLTADATHVDHSVKLAFSTTARHLTVAGDGTISRGIKTHLFVSGGARVRGSTVSYIVPAGQSQSVYVAWLIDPGPTLAFTLDEDSYLTAKQALATFWARKLTGSATFEVPEVRVQNAERSLVIQNLALAWRYSAGNGYHSHFFTPEAVDTAGVMGEYGFEDVNRATLDVASWRKLSWTANWRMGARLLGTARYYRLFHDRAYLAAHTRTLASYVSRLRAQLVVRHSRLLRRERFSADVWLKVYGLHSQTVAWQGLREMASVWVETGEPELAARARAVARRLGAGLHRAAKRSARRMRDGSLFVPIRLLDDERPYRRLTASRPGSYWNLVMPYALASGIFPPDGTRAKGTLRYLRAHGSLLLGLVRAGAYTIYGLSGSKSSGTDQVYGLNLARFLADNDRPDLLVVSLYGQLAAGMTHGTYVSGEAATVSPLRGAYYRAMFRPPNSATNSAFLETLRLMLVHEVRGSSGAARGLELAFATPRSWLVNDRQIAVRDAPTSFGRLSYTVAAKEGEVDAWIDVPESATLKTLKLRLRLPRGQRVLHVDLDGSAYSHFDPATGTLNLSGRRGSLFVQARVSPAR
jgi:hypothetical protein